MSCIRVPLVALAWRMRMRALGVPVELVLLLDSVSWFDEPIPDNVGLAAVSWPKAGWTGIPACGSARPI